MSRGQRASLDYQKQSENNCKREQGGMVKKQAEKNPKNKTPMKQHQQQTPNLEIPSVMAN